MGILNSNPSATNNLTEASYNCNKNILNANRVLLSETEFRINEKNKSIYQLIDSTFQEK